MATCEWSRATESTTCWIWSCGEDFSALVNSSPIVITSVLPLRKSHLGSKSFGRHIEPRCPWDGTLMCSKYLLRSRHYLRRIWGLLALQRVLKSDRVIQFFRSNLRRGSNFTGENAHLHMILPLKGRAAIFARYRLPLNLVVSALPPKQVVSDSPATWRTYARELATFLWWSFSTLATMSERIGRNRRSFRLGASLEFFSTWYPLKNHGWNNRISCKSAYKIV